MCIRIRDRKKCTHNENNERENVKIAAAGIEMGRKSCDRGMSGVR